MDRYLARVQGNRMNLQLICATSTWIAAKYEEIYPVEVKDCVYASDRAFTKQQVLDILDTGSGQFLGHAWPHTAKAGNGFGGYFGHVWVV